jgi:hypothetical protein
MIARMWQQCALDGFDGLVDGGGRVYRGADGALRRNGISTGNGFFQYLSIDSSGQVLCFRERRSDDPHVVLGGDADKCSSIQVGGARMWHAQILRG